MPNHIALPVGPSADWELDEEEADVASLKSVAESFTVLQSLRQSRDKWLSSTFPKFSTKSRGTKPADIIPPPHSIRFHGRCDLEIGPHIFPDTGFFEVQYLPQYSGQSYSSPSNSSPSGSWPAASYGNVNQVRTSTYDSIRASSSTTQRASTPLISSLASEVSVTPSLVSQVNAAAATNPTLANLVYLAAAGRATPEQLRTLGVLIQSMATSTSLPPETTSVAPSSPSLMTQGYHVNPPSSAQQTSYASVSSKDFDLVIEFRESSSERHIFPHGPVVCKKILTDDLTPLHLCDIQISTAVPFVLTANAKMQLLAESSSKGEKAPFQTPPHVVTFHLKKASANIWDLMSRWAGDEQKLQDSQRILEQMITPERVCLQHRLPEGDLLNEVKNAAIHDPPMKSIKPAQFDNLRPKRKPAYKNFTPDKLDSQIASSSAPAKKRRVYEAKKSTTPPMKPRIACFSCGQTDVPLLMGGRFCRQCIDAGKASNYIPLQNNDADFRSMAQIHGDGQEQSNTGIVVQKPPRKPKAGRRTSATASPSFFVSSPLATNPPLFPPVEQPTQYAVQGTE